MNRSTNYSFNAFQLLLVGIGGYLLWTNRFRIQQLLEANGISTPWMTGNATDAIGSGVAKVSGKIDHELNVSKAV